MNIFVLSYDPVHAAQMQCDKHVVKMILESAQLLSTAHHELDSPYKDQCYKPTHKNHPCAKWVRESADNYLWLYDHMIALGEEYTHRYGKIHKTIRERAPVLKNVPPALEATGFTLFPLCMPDEYKSYDDFGDADVVGSYRAYYIGDKSRFAAWNKTRNPPYWWTGKQV
jgi:hypothetical protein